MSSIEVCQFGEHFEAHYFELCIHVVKADGDLAKAAEACLAGAALRCDGRAVRVDVGLRLEAGVGAAYEGGLGRGERSGGLNIGAG